MSEYHFAIAFWSAVFAASLLTPLLLTVSERAFRALKGAFDDLSHAAPVSVPSHPAPSGRH